MNQKLNMFYKVKKAILNFLFAKVGYYDGQLYQLDYSNKSKKVVTNFSPWLLIVSNRFYEEKVLTFPVVENKEVAKLIKLASSANTVSYIASKSNDNTFVNQWVFNSSITTSFIQLPESYLFGKDLEVHHIVRVQESPDKAFYVAKSPSNIIRSADEFARINSFDMFAMSVGMQANHQHSLDESQKVNTLIKNLCALDITQLVQFIKLPTKVSLSKILQGLIIPGFVLFAGFLCLSSAFLLMRGAYLDHQINAIQGDVSGLLESYSDYEAERSIYQQLYLISESADNHLGLIASLAPIFDIATISSVRYELGRYIVQGEVEKASVLLELLSTQPNVQEAKFDLPVTKNGARERFTLSFSITPALSLPKLG